MVTYNFEKVLHKGVAMEKQISTNEERSNRRSSNSDSWISHRQFHLSLNRTGEFKSPQAGETLLFISQINQDEGQLMY